jgi:hypothetical protein
VTPAVTIAATGDLNPHWFGHPGSTIIYPLAGTFHAWNAIAHDGELFGPDADLLTEFQSDSSDFYMLGRLLTIAYGVMSVPLVYLVGRRVFGERVALMGAAISMLYPLAVSHAQLVRTDSAAVFFGLLALWLCLRLYDRPTVGNQALAGLGIGVAMSSRYFMVTLVPVLLAVDGMILWGQTAHRQTLRTTWPAMGTGLLAVAAGFALTTPYFFLDFEAALQSVRAEAQSTHLGADGLSPPENFLWYLSHAIPLSITWPQMILAALGATVAIWRRRPKELLLVGLALVFLVAISLSPLHWQRWIIPILPLLALFIAYALYVIVQHLSAQMRSRVFVHPGLILLVVFLVSAWPAYNLVLQDVRQASPSTRILAREWIMENLPPDSRMAQEWYTAPLAGTRISLSEYVSLATLSLDDYRHDGFEYLMVSSAMYERYLDEPARYPDQVAFYETLFDEAHLLQQFEPSNTRGGPIVRIYELEQPESD